MLFLLKFLAKKSNSEFSVFFQSLIHSLAPNFLFISRNLVMFIPKKLINAKSNRTRTRQVRVTSATRSLLFCIIYDRVLKQHLLLSKMENFPAFFFALEI